MTEGRDFKRLVRTRMRETGEPYTVARAHLLRHQRPALMQAPNSKAIRSLVRLGEGLRELSPPALRGRRGGPGMHPFDRFGEGLRRLSPPGLRGWRGGGSGMYPFDRFTRHAQTVLNLAQEEAEAAGHRYIGTEHLLFALVRERESLAGRVLTQIGVKLDAIRRQVEATVTRPDPPSIEKLVPTSRVKKVIELAFAQSQRMGDGHVGTEHLLLGLLIEGHGVVAQVLLDQGITVAHVRGAVGRARLTREVFIEAPGIRSSPEVTHVLQRALELAQGEEASSVTLEHLRHALEEAPGEG